MASDKIDIERCYVEGPYQIDYAQEVYVCRSRDFPFPLGIVWGEAHWNEKKEWTHFNVNGSYVMGFARRKGVRTMINDELLKRFKAVTTGTGTKLGKPFMKKSGYKFDPIFDYVLKRKKK